MALRWAVCDCLLIVDYLRYTSCTIPDMTVAPQPDPRAYMRLRATLPRLRYDQLMSFGWKILLPLATLNALVTAIIVVAVHS